MLSPELCLSDLQTGLTTDLYIISGIMFFLAGCLYSMAFLNIWLVPSERPPSLHVPLCR